MPSTHHPTYEFATSSGPVLRSHCSHPIDRTEISDPKLWGHILDDQLLVTAEEFWACVDNGIVPRRGQDGRGLAGTREAERAKPLTLSLARALMQHLGLKESELAEISQDQAVAMLSQHFSKPPDG